MAVSTTAVVILGNAGSKVGAIDGMIGATTSVASGDGVGVITGTISSVSSAVGMFPGPIGGLANAVAVGVTVGKVGGTDQITWGDVLGVIGGVAGIVAATAAAPGLIALGTIISVGAGAASIAVTISGLDSPINGTVNDKTGEAVAPPRRDPLALDLDSDGIETIGLPSEVAPITFDHNADGVKTGTGWLKPDDAWLVLDRNGNGTIDSGRELFGVDTQITVNGETRPATSGFEALSALDRGAGTVGSAGYDDKIFDAKDADFTRVRLWQDLNQDGVSQANELFTLAQKGVTSISLTPTTEATPLGNGNVITGRATVRFTNNTTTQMDSVAVSDRTAGNLELVDNPFYREFTTAIPHTAAAAAMPEMRGSGMVRDMREALSLGNANSTSLASVLQQYTQAKTRDAQIALLDQLIFRWGDTSTMQTSITTDRRPSATGPFTAIEAWGLANLPLFMKINALEQFNGTSILSRFVVASGNAFTVAPLDSWRIEALEAAWAALRESVYGGLVLQTRLKPYLDTIQLTFGGDGLAIDATPLTTKLETLRSQDPKNALVDLAELTRYASTTLNSLEYDHVTLLRGWIDSLPPGSPLLQSLIDLGIFSRPSINGNSVYFGTDAKDDITAGTGNNVLDGGGGDDVLRGGDGSDIIHGSKGSDSLYGYGGADTLRGGEGVDYLDGGVGADELYGGADTDTLIGSAGSDRLHGQDGDDTLYGDEDNDSLEGGNGADILYGGIGDDALLGGDGDDTLSGYHGADVLEGGAGSDKLDGGNGQDRLLGGEARDLLYGGEDNDYLEGQDGNDEIYGDGGDDILSGGAGDDLLVGGAGGDAMHGGIGKDRLSGGYGNDTYIVLRGDGEDTIADGTASASATDRLNFIGVSSSDVIALERRGQNLYMKYGVADALTIENYFVANALVETIFFANGVSWDLGYAKQNVLTTGTAGADIIVGFNDAANRIVAGDGIDTVTGGSLGDQMDGGAGNDRLEGRGGNDTYIIRRADGNDIILDIDTAPSNADIVKFTDIKSTDVTLERRGNNLLVGYAFGSLTIEGYFTGKSHVVETLSFADGVTLNEISVKTNARTVGTTVDDVITGYDDGPNRIWSGDGSDTIYGGGQGDSIYGENDKDYIYAGSGMDFLWGGAGDDALLGEGGNDYLIGGTGADYLNGGEGDDVYIFTPGDLTSSTWQADRIYDGGGYDKAYIDKDMDVSNVELDNFSGDLNILFNDSTSLTLMNAFRDSVEELHTPRRVYSVPDLIMDLARAKVQYTTREGETIVGGMDEDRLTANGNGSLLKGGKGRDTYIINPGVMNTGVFIRAGDGYDILTWTPSTSPTGNYVQFGSGISYESVMLKGSGSPDPADGYAFELSWGGAPQEVLHLGRVDLTQGHRPFDELRFQDGRKIGWQQLLQRGVLANNEWGTALNDTFNWADLGTALGATLTGRAGDDTYVFRYGAGAYRAEISDVGRLASDREVVKFEDVTRANAIFAKEGNDLTIRKRTYSDPVQWGYYDQETVVVKNAFTTNPVNVKFQGEDRLFAISELPLMTLMATATSGNDYLKGTSTPNTLDGLAGDDLIEGWGGVDTLTGNAGNDYLYGGDGNDILRGGAGADFLSGDAGADIYHFARGDGADVIQDYDGTGAMDKLQFAAGIAQDQLWFRRAGNGLEVSVIGSPDKITVLDWYDGAGHQIEQFSVASGKSLAAGKVNALVDAMAAFAPPAAGQTTLPATYQTALNGVIAANWA